MEMQVVNMTPFWAGMLFLMGLGLGAFLVGSKVPWSKWPIEERRFVQGCLCGLAVGLMFLAPGAGIFAAFLFGFFFGVVGELAGAFRFIKDTWDLFAKPEWMRKSR